MTKKSLNNYIRIWARRIMALRSLGGKCEKCSVSNIFVLDFHHKGKKEINVNVLLRARQYSDAEKEIKKCKLLCKNCHHVEHFYNAPKDNRFLIMKKKLLDIKGISRCERCGHANISALHFHHHNKDKKFNIGTFIARKIKVDFDEVIAEVRKCTVLCGNCHAIEHTNISIVELHRKQIYHLADNYTEIHKKLDSDQVLVLIQQGKTRKRISETLGCSIQTVKDIARRLQKRGLLVLKKNNPPLDKKTIFELRQQGLKHKEIAGRLHCNVHSVKKIWARMKMAECGGTAPHAP